MAELESHRASRGSRGDQQHKFSHDGKGGAPISIGLVNNMAGAAFNSARKQFSSLISEASGELPIRIRVLSPVIQSNSDSGGHRVFRHPDDMEELWTGAFDGIIVTGSEPQACRLIDEPAWPFLTRLVEWCEDNVASAVWSCMATQAAVFHLDGIERRPFKTKLSGVFECQRVANDAILNEFPRRWKAPHSRYNDLPEAVLDLHGYRILAQSRSAGADIFTKQGRSRHFFMQGHLEYDGGVLSREYRRDVGRFLAGESDRYPEMPIDYFPEDLGTALTAFRQRALSARSQCTIADFPPRAETATWPAPWRPVAVQFYRNWLACLREAKTESDATRAQLLG
jgi:homoserine O-succinyltransferase/O-acetyltransferase